jgi:hypothetical protein
MNGWKVTLMLCALGAYAAMLWDELGHPERLLRRQASVASAPAPVSERGRPTASTSAPMLAWTTGLYVPVAASFRDPVRDVFGYREPPAPRVFHPRPPPAPKPAPVRPPRIDKGRFELHGIRDRPASGQREAFLSLDGTLYILHKSDVLPGGFRVTDIGLAAATIATAEGDEEVEFSLR